MSTEETAAASPMGSMDSGDLPLSSDALPPPVTEAPTPPPAPRTRLMITKMRLENFKSYAGPVEIGPFHKCFSAVVGPNGSGKSNVIDALLFVFGKRASKLRLKKVSELVHRSASYPNLETASVSVFFHEIYDDDDTSQDPEEAEKDAQRGVNDENYRIVPNSQLCVTRSATKSNVSKYFIDHNPSNFTQVTTLLRSKGIDLDNNRFLILQGEVEQIAMMKSKGDESKNGGEDGLLEYLEDIIGSNVYVEPTERVWQQVEEGNDVRNEKVNRVKLVEKEKAHLEGPRAEALEFLRKERDVYVKTNILYQLWIQEASKNRKLCEHKKNELQKQYDEEIKKMEANKVQLEQVEEVYKQVKDAHDVCSAELEAVNKVYADFEKQDVKLREELKYAKEKMVELEDTQKKEKKKQKEIAKKQHENEEVVPKLEQEIEKLQLQLKKQEQVLETILQEHKEETTHLRTQMEAMQQEMEPFHTQLNSFRSEIDMADTEIQLIEEPVTSAKKALESNAIGLHDAEEAIEQLTSQQESHGGEVSTMTKRLKDATRELESVKAKDTELSEKYRDARAKADEATSSVHSQASRGRMLKSLLDASRPGQPLENAGLCGRLGDLGAIDGKYDVAISTACGSLDHLVVATTSGAQACVQFLRQHNLGRTTFLILEQLGYLESKYSQAFRPVKSCPRLFDLVQVKEKKFLTAFYYALRDTLVAKDLDEATSIAYQGSQCKYRVVTLDGQLVELSGAMSGGGNRVRKGGMSTSLVDTMSDGEIQALQHTAKELKDQLDNVRDKKIALEREVSGLTKKLDQFERDFPKIEMNLNAAKTKFHDLTQNRKELEKKGKISDADKKKIANLQKDKKQKEKEYSKIKQVVDEKEADLAELKKKILDVGGAKLRKEQEVASKITKQIEEKTKQMTKIKVDFKSSQKNTEKNAKLLESVAKELETTAEQIELIREQCSEMEDKAIEVLQNREAVEEEVKGKEKALRKEEKKYTKLKKQYDEMRSGEVDLQNSLEDCAKILEENTKKETYWSSKLATLHANFKTEQEQNAGVFDDDDALPQLREKESVKSKSTKSKKPGQKNKTKKISKNKKTAATKKTTTKKKKLTVKVNEDDEDEEQKNGEDGDVDMADEDDEDDDEEAAEEEEDEEMEEGDDEDDEQEEESAQTADEGDHAQQLPMLDAKQLSKYNKEEIKYEISVLEQQRDELKANVNMGALTEYKQKEVEHQSRLQELDDATRDRDQKRNEYDELRRKRLEEFMAGFRVITLKLKEMYQMITLGGDAELELVDSLDPFSEGVVFSVRPSKKSWKNISNLSGGEKTLASLALVFALHHYKPTPLYVMDEIDAALDFKNVSIVGNYIKQRTRNAQFIIISLRNNMFELADRLVGIYKTNDATKSVTINPKLYQNIAPAAASTKQSTATMDGSDELADARRAKRSRRSERKEEEEGGGAHDDDGMEPLRDATNRR